MTTALGCACLFALEHDLFRKPVSTFRDHAREHFVTATAALDQPGGERAALWQSRCEFANFPSESRVESAAARGSEPGSPLRVGERSRVNGSGPKWPAR